MHHVDPALQIDHLANNMRRSAGSGSRKVDLAGIFLCVLDKVGDAIYWKRWIYCKYQHIVCDRANWHQCFSWVEWKVLLNSGVDRDRCAHGKKERVAVRCCICDRR